MRLFRLLLAAVALSAEAPPPNFQPFEQALASSNLADAARFVDQQIAERTPADGMVHADALLNALLGRLYLAGQNAGAAQIYLDHLNLTELPASLRGPTALARARTLELRGNRAGALAAYRAAAVELQDGAVRRRAAIGAARQLLPEDPAAARELLLEIANGPANAERWNAKYLLAASSSLTGDSASATRWANAAWTDAFDAGVSDLATLHVAALRAGLAAANHDLTMERAMLIAANGLDLAASPALSSQLPVCGDRGLKSSDYVVFAFVSGPYLTRELTPIAASRVAAVAPFQDALLAVAPIKLQPSTGPVGTVLTVSCRTVVSPNFSRTDINDPLLDWFVANGIYPASASNNDDDAQVNAVGDRIANLEQRFGKASSLLIGPRWQMILLLEKRARAGATVSPGQVADLSSEVAAGMRRASAPQWMPKVIELRSAIEQTAGKTGTSLSAPSLNGLAREELAQAPFPIARELLLASLANFDGHWPDEASQFIIDLNGRLPATVGGRDRQAWLVSVAQAQKLLGKGHDAKITLASAGLPTDLCATADEDPALLEQHFSYADYPHELQVGAQEGSVMFDFDLSPTGSVASHRIVYSLPSNLFDDASAKGLATVRYTAPRKAGRASGCKGLFQPIIWRLENNDDFSIPTFTSETAGPTT